MKETWWKLGVEIMIPIVVLLIWLAVYKDPDGAFENVKEIGSGLKNFVNVSIGAQQTKAETPTPPFGHTTAINVLKEKMKEMQGKSNCFANYGGLPPFGEKGTSLRLEYRRESQETNVIIQGGPEGLQEVSSEKIEKIHPCVIAGEKDGLIAAHFMELLQRQATSDYYLPVDSIFIQGDNEKNTIIYGSETLPLPDSGWLYTPDGQHICFFPEGDNDKKGMDKDFFIKDEEGSLSQYIGLGTAKLCADTGIINVTYNRYKEDDTKEAFRFLYQGRWTYWDPWNKQWRLTNDLPEGDSEEGITFIHPEFFVIFAELVTLDEAAGIQYFTSYSLPSPWLKPKVAIEGTAPLAVQQSPPIVIDSTNDIAFIYSRNPQEKGWHFKEGEQAWQRISRHDPVRAELQDIAQKTEEEGYVYLAAQLSPRRSLEASP